VLPSAKQEVKVARIVLVHGAFSGAWCWEPAVPGLTAAGHEVRTLDLPSHGEDDTPVAEVTLDAYAAKVCSVLAEGPPAVLVGHSMGGVVITQAAGRCPELIAGLVYLAAFLPADGESLLALTQLPEGAGDQVQANLAVAGDPPVATMPPQAARMAIHGCADDEAAAWALARRGPQPVAPFGQPVRIESGARDAYERLPRAYVTCLQDRAIPPALQRRMLEAAGCDPVIEIDTDHAPMISRIDETVTVLDALARSHEPARSGPINSAGRGLTEAAHRLGSRGR
jgi:pimeloyl-ACP methyl ester carboxylesterase